MNKEFLVEKIRIYRVPFFGVLATLALVAAYIVRTSPAGELDEQYNALTSEVGLLLSNSRNGADLAENLETIRQYTDLMGERFISQNLADIHDVFYTLERQTGVSLESFQRPEMVSEPIKPKANEVEYQPLSMAVTISGTFKNVIKFIRSLESSPLLYRYNGLKISSNHESVNADLISLTLNLELLSLNDE